MNMTRRHWSILGVLGGAALMNLAACGDDTGEGGSGGGGAAPSGGSILITASGESMAVTGIAFPPVEGEHVEETEEGHDHDHGSPVFVDGWEVMFKRVLVTVDKFTLSENPDLNPGDQSKTGAVVAEVTGPFAVDLHKGGDVPGQAGTEEKAELNAAP